MSAHIRLDSRPKHTWGARLDVLTTWRKGRTHREISLMPTVSADHHGIVGSSPTRAGTVDGLPIARDLSLAYLASLVVAALLAIVSAVGRLAPSGLYGRDPTLTSVFVG